MKILEFLEQSFIAPEKTEAGVSFCDIPIPVTFDNSTVTVFGVPIDITTTFGKSTSKGPQAIRKTSSEQIETLIFEKNKEIFEKSLIYDLGDFVIDDQENIETHNIQDVIQFWETFDIQITKVIKNLLKLNKMPLILGGEHTLTYSVYKEFSSKDPLLLHFDAHRDMKQVYKGMKICHTTPFYHLINEGYLKGKNLAQIGIRQGDKQENDFALENQVSTFDAWYCHNCFSDLLNWIKVNTIDRNIYVSFDIDVYDISYLPCTGTPEPFGLTPFQISDIINSIHHTANLVGIDFVETGLKNNDFREGALATQTLLRFLSADYIKNKL